MARRIDYYDDPDAPKANSVVPAAVAVVAREDGAVLLIRRTDNGNWALPGGAIDLGESVAQAAVRETLEESGIECAITGHRGNLLRPRARDSLHQQRRGTAGVLHRAHRPTPGRAANAEQRVKRGPLGAGVRGPRVHDGPVDAHSHQRLPGTQRLTRDHLAQPGRGPDQAVGNKPIAIRRSAMPVLRTVL